MNFEKRHVYKSGTIIVYGVEYDVLPGEGTTSICFSLQCQKIPSGNLVALRGPFYGHESGPYCVRTRRILRITRISHNIVAYRNISFVTRFYMFFVTVF